MQSGCSQVGLIEGMAKLQNRQCEMERAIIFNPCLPPWRRGPSTPFNRPTDGMTGRPLTGSELRCGRLIVQPWLSSAKLSSAYLRKAHRAAVVSPRRVRKLRLGGRDAATRKATHCAPHEAPPSVGLTETAARLRNGMPGVVWCGVVWCGVVWRGVAWGGVAWRGVMWYGVRWYDVL